MAKPILYTQAATSGEPKPKTICGQFGGRDEPAAAASDGFINGLFVGCLHTYLYILYCTAYSSPYICILIGVIITDRSIKHTDKLKP